MSDARRDNFGFFWDNYLIISLHIMKNNFNYTPVKIVNDKLFPTEYELNELKYFLNDFIEEKEVEVLEQIA